MQSCDGRNAAELNPSCDRDTWKRGVLPQCVRVCTLFAPLGQVRCCPALPKGPSLFSWGANLPGNSQRSLLEPCCTDTGGFGAAEPPDSAQPRGNWSCPNELELLLAANAAKPVWMSYLCHHQSPSPGHSHRAREAPQRGERRESPRSCRGLSRAATVVPTEHLSRFPAARRTRLHVCLRSESGVRNERGSVLSCRGGEHPGVSWGR